MSASAQDRPPSSDSTMPISVPTQIRFGSFGPHDQIVDGHVGEAARADGHTLEAGDVGPGRTQVRGPQHLGALGEGEQREGRVGLGRVGGQARDATQALARIERRRTEGSTRIDGDRQQARSVHARARPHDVGVRIADAHVMKAAQGAPHRGVHCRHVPTAAEVVADPHALRADRVDRFGARLALADLGDEGRGAAAGVGQTVAGALPGEPTVEGALQPVELRATDDLQRIVEVPRGLVAVATDHEGPGRVRDRIDRREPRAVVLRATRVGAASGRLVDTVELRGDHAVGRHRESGHVVRRAGHATVVRAEQVPVAAGRLHDLEIVVIRMREGVAGQTGGRARARTDRAHVDLPEFQTTDEDDRRIGRMANDRVVVPTLRAEPVRLTARFEGLEPVRAAVRRHPELGVRSAHRRGVQVLGVDRRHGDFEAAREVGDAVVDVVPGRAAVVRLENAAPVDGRVQGVEVEGIGDELQDAAAAEVRGARLLVDLGPVRTSVDRTEDARRVVRQRLPAARGDRSEDHVLVRRIDEDARHVVPARVTDRRGNLRPAFAAIGRLEDPVAVHDVDVPEALAGAGVDHVLVAGRHRDRGDLQVGHVAGQFTPRGARVLGLPHAAADAGDVPGVSGRIDRIDDDAARPAGDVARSALDPRQGRGYAAAGEARALDFAQLVARRVLDRRAIARDLPFVEVARVLVRETRLRASLEIGVDAIDLRLELDRARRTGFHALQLRFQLRAVGGGPVQRIRARQGRRDEKQQSQEGQAGEGVAVRIRLHVGSEPRQGVVRLRGLSVYRMRTVPSNRSDSGDVRARDATPESRCTLYTFALRAELGRRATHQGDLQARPCPLPEDAVELHLPAHRFDAFAGRGQSHAGARHATQG